MNRIRSLVFALVLATVPGCGASALATQADIGAVVGTTLAAADGVLIQTREADLNRLLEAAAAECGPEGCSEAREVELVAAYDARVTAWAPALACREPVVQGYQAWLDAIWLASIAANADLGWEHVVAEAARLGLLWRGFRACVEAASRSLGASLELPDLPAFVYPYLESAAP